MDGCYNTQDDGSLGLEEAPGLTHSATPDGAQRVVHALYAVGVTHGLLQEVSLPFGAAKRFV